MAANAAAVQAGQDVVGTDGEKIGSVVGVLKETSASAIPKAGLDMPEDIERERPHREYIRVEAGGLLGTNMREFYVPFDAIQSVSDQAVTLNCTADDCQERFSTKPDFV